MDSDQNPADLDIQGAEFENMCTVHISVAPIMQVRHMCNKNSNIQGRSPYEVK